MIDASGDAITADGPTVPPTACGATQLVSDGFDTGVTTGVWIVSNGTGLSIQQANSNMEVDFAATVNAGKAAYYRSANAFASDGLCGVAEVAGTPSAPAASMFVKLYTSAQMVDFDVHGGVVDLRSQSNQTLTTYATLPWDPVADRFLRLRHASGVTYWDTSPDGTTYVQRFSATGFPVANCQLELGAGAETTASNAGAALFASAAAYGP